jgi:hypothetical protein
MRSSPSSVVASAVAALAFAAGPAHADNLDGGVTFKSVAIEGNPLGVVIGRYSADLEYLPVPHHALHLTPVGYYALPGVADELIGGGAELGYRWYSGEYGPHGIFVGASVIALSLEYIHHAAPGVPMDRSDDTTYVQLGGALDAGYQVIALGNLAVCAGVGAQYTVDTTTNFQSLTQPHFEFTVHPWHDFFFGEGLRPRALLSVGAAF